MRTRAGLLAIACLVAAGCVQLQYERDNRLEPVSAPTVDGLVPGESKLEDCLAALGAPLFVRERQTYGAELAYGWAKQRGWSVRVSVPVAESASASFDYDNIDEKLRGAVLLFDEDWTLELVRIGYLRDLVAREVTPAYLEDGETPGDAGGRDA